MKIYTRKGDDGTTGLLTGQRVGKDDARVACCGEVDELNAMLGWAGAAADEVPLAQLRQVQSDLLTIGAHLAVVGSTQPSANLPALDAAMVARLEQQIDEAEKQLPPLRQFILPGGTELASRLHVGRAVCRRAERAIVALHNSQPIPPLVLTFLNRLSDWLFVMARLADHIAGVADVGWHAHAGRARP